MELPKTIVKASRKDPRLLVLFGQSKVGKTTTLAQLEDCLILDTEQGSDMVDALKVSVNSLKDMGEVYKALLAERKETGKPPYKYIALDTIDNLVDWLERSVCKGNGVTNLIDIPYGAGYNEVRLKTMQWITRLKNVAPHVILIGHRKKTIITDNTDVTVETSSLELSGRLKNIIMADADATGYVFRQKDEDADTTSIKVSFMASDELEAGSRCEHLRGTIIPFEWGKIFIE